MKSESPGPKPGAITRTHDSSGQPAGSPETTGRMGAHYAQTGLEVFPVDPDTKAPIGPPKAPTAKPYGWPPKATVRHHDPQSSPHGGNCDPMP